MGQGHIWDIKWTYSGHMWDMGQSVDNSRDTYIVNQHHGFWLHFRYMLHLPNNTHLIV